MGATTGISWTDATVNFWWGCTKVGPGCDHCYAETLNAFRGNKQWGLGAPRRKIKGAVTLMRKLDNGYSEWAADAEVARHNARAFGLPIPVIGNSRRVFIQSMSDLFDLEVPPEWFDEAWRTIHDCARIEVQIVTKRSGAVEKRLALATDQSWPRHAGLIFSVVNQVEADRDISRLLDLMARFNIPWVGLSCEPMLGRIVLPEAFLKLGKRAWVIAGGESGAKARPAHPDWFRSLRDQCAIAGVPFHFKQWGEWASAAYHMGTGQMVFRQFETFAQWVGKASTWVNGGICLDANGTALRNGGDFMAARDEGRFPVTIMHRIGTKKSGNHLDGRQHLEFPR